MRRDDPPSVPVKPKGFDNASGTVTRSNPPFPLFINDGQVPPEAFGLTAYTTRPPWMTDNASVPDISGVTRSYVVDGTSLSPFETATPAPPQPSTTAEPSAAQPAAAPEPVPYEPGSVPRRAGSGALIRLLVVGVKVLPLMAVVAGGYYTYAYYFGPVPIVQRLLHPGAAPAAPAKSKAAAMVDMTREVVARNNSRVELANELAGDGPPLDQIKDPPIAKAGTPAADQPREPAAAPVVNHTRSDAVDPLEPIAGPNDHVTIATTNRSAVPIAGTASPSTAFLAWVRQADVTGVRSGQSPRAIVNGVTYRLNATVDFGLKITFVGIDEATQRVLFRDATGAVVGKDYY